jgi:hypothetical protein
VTNSAPTPAHPQGLAIESLVLPMLREILGLSFDQCYYVVVLSFLLIYYLHDHVLLTQPDVILMK